MRATRREPAPKEPHGIGVVLRRGTLLSLLVAVVLTLTLEVSTSVARRPAVDQ